MPKVSVIVPVYKVEKYLIQCIESILNQTLKDIEVILVDEGDLDECRAIIDMYEFGAKKDTRVKSIHEKNGGYGASVNKGLDIATGEYISIIESDDFIAPEMLEEVYEYAKKFDVDVVKMPYYEYWDKSDEQNETVRICDWLGEFVNIPEGRTFRIEEFPIFLSIHPSIWSALYKREFLKRKNIRCLEAKGAGYIDNYFRIETFLKAEKIAWKNKPYNYYRLSNPNASQALYNLSVFIQRWNDVHKLFEREFSKQKDALLPYCLIEEYINVFKPLFGEKYSLSEEDLKILVENLSYMALEDIKNSKLLARRKRRLLELKRNPDKLNKFLTLTKPQIKGWFSLIGAKW